MSASLNTQSLFSLWDRCSEYLNDELPQQQFNTWIKPLEVVEGDREAANAPGNTLVLAAPNRFIKDWVSEKFLLRLEEFARLFSDGAIKRVHLEVASAPRPVFLSDGAERPEPPGFNAELAAFPDSASLAGERRLSAVGHVDENSTQRNQPGNDNLETRAGSSARSNHHSLLTPATSDLVDELDLGTPKLSFEVSDEAFLNSAHTVANRAPADAQEDIFGENWSATEIQAQQAEPVSGHRNSVRPDVSAPNYPNNILGRYRFDNFVEGKSNQLARAAAIQVVENPSGSYNPLFLYGGVGLGKTHLMHAVGNEIKRRNPGAKVVYLHAERFVGDMVKALQLNAINEFKRYYRSVDTLLIDDIQFFANKERSQEEFFHTFNALLEGGHQMIFSCDRYPKSITGVEERLKSRFGWGLTVQIEAPELETRVAILKRKAEQENIQIPNDAAFFLANKVRANVRELEGALKRVNANADFLKAPITVELIKESLKDLLALQEKMVSIDNIQRIVAEYFTIKVADLNSKRRNRSVARPRQMAMALAKELTNHSLPEIGNAFGGRDHTTVLHACRKIKELRDSSSDLSEDYHNLIRLLST